MLIPLRWLVGVFIIALCILFAVIFLPDGRSSPETDTPGVFGAPAAITDTIKRGEYLARAADCQACHTQQGGRAYAGGRTFELPFGTLFSTNITADQANGIGTWSDDEFVKAVREGVGRGGHLYPAMPYTSYAALSTADVLAIKAYLFSLPPVPQPNRVNAIGFPFSQRWSLHFWDVVFFRNQSYQVDVGKDQKWNRGAYLTNALGHCGECHTPRNLGFAMNTDKFLAGAEIEGWVAPNLSSDKSAGIGAWTSSQLQQYLSTGHASGRSSASGPMAEVIEASLQYLSPEDVSAMAMYLSAVVAQPGGVSAAVNLQRSRAVSAVSNLPLEETGKRGLGSQLFAGDCAGCHLWSGSGRQSHYADLLGTRSVNDPAARSVIQVILNGTHLTVGNQQEVMPSFGAKYSDAEVAEIANYLLALFGNRTGAVTAAQVTKQRGG
jgi:mono/diheme cytochrome c family protein